MRLAIAYLRVRDMITLGKTFFPVLKFHWFNENIIVPEPPEPDDHKILTDDSIFLKALEGFLLVMSSDGDIVYTSENVSDYLGITQVDWKFVNSQNYSLFSDWFDGPKYFWIQSSMRSWWNQGNFINKKSRGGWDT